MLNVIVRSVFCLALLPVYVGSAAQAETRQLRLVPTSPAAGAPRLALVIGNSDYTGNQLKNPVNDARSMATALQSLGFGVTLGENLNRRQMETALRELGQKLTPQSVALFYFSGHGAQVKGVNYLLPVNADIQKETDLEFEAVDAGRVLGEMEDAKSPINIVILDACRDNPFLHSGRSTSRGLAKMDAPAGSIIAYATAPGHTASDNTEGENGLYTQELLKQIQTPGLRIEDVLKKARVSVSEISHGAQLPWDESSLLVDFYLRNPMPRSWPPRTPAVHEGIIPGIPITAINPTDGAEMIFIPAGPFTMGATDGADNEKPAHKVYLSEYWMYKNDVTVAQYKQFCQATGHQMPVAPDWGWKDDHPVVNVSRDDARAYCDWAGVALPTEAQWEKAARGTDGRMYPWGNDWDPTKSCSSVGTARQGTVPAGSFPSGTSPYGVLDMAGNVWNWCADWFDNDYYNSADHGINSRDPSGPVSGSVRVLRGGAWSNDSEYSFRCSIRLYNDPAVLYSNYVGFRGALRAGS